LTLDRITSFSTAYLVNNFEAALEHFHEIEKDLKR